MSALAEKQVEADLMLTFAAEHGLKGAEYERALQLLGRPLTRTEAAMFGAMWSEHCSYKSSKVWLRQLPTEGARVICGPGENAGVVDIGDGLAAIFKIESHNHPSFIEPYQGAATGVGGILRDVFTMGARPIASLNALRFGDIQLAKTRQLLEGVVAGIGGYGNCVGVPTVGGELNFHPAYNQNCLVNAMCVGIAKTDKIFYAAATGVGNPVVYVGSKTGRDGIKGAAMSSAEFSSATASMKPTVQVGDPFAEKLLIEACLELMQRDAILAIQDMGAAGLTSSAVEMAARGGLSIMLDLDCVPLREQSLGAYEIMLSESQERMLMILRPGMEPLAKEIFEKWDLDFAVIGRLTAPTEGGNGSITILRHGVVEALLPLLALTDEAPRYERPYTRAQRPAPLDATQYPLPKPLLEILTQLMACPDLCSRDWVRQQYDESVGANTLRLRGGADAGLVRVEGTQKALALTVDCTPRYCFADAEEGGKQAVAEAWRNITATGALPIALSDNMNFGNPEKPEIMGQFVGCILGMRAACLALDFPIVSGNVSLYNETQGQAILPTPVMAGLGLLENYQLAVGMAPQDGDTLLLIGECAGALGQSLYLREIHGLEIGAPPPVDLAAERRHGDFVRQLIQDGLLHACHDVSDGGLLVALAEMALAADIGLEIFAAGKTGDGAGQEAGFWFGEDQARYVLATSEPQKILALASALNVPVQLLGVAAGDSLALHGEPDLPLATLRAAHEATLPKLMGHS